MDGQRLLPQLKMAAGLGTERSRPDDGAGLLPWATRSWLAAAATAGAGPVAAAAVAVEAHTMQHLLVALL